MPVLEWWAGIYDAVFVALNPFVRPGDDREPLLGYAPSGGPPARTLGLDDRIKSTGAALRWSRIHREAAPQDDWLRTCRAIQTWSALGLYDDGTLPVQRRIAAYCEAERILSPFTDCMPAISEPAIGRFLDALGTRSVTAYSEFRDERFELSAETFRADRPATALPRAKVYALHAPAAGVAMFWQFDAAYALIAMSGDALASVPPEAHFEGWYADARTLAAPHRFARRD